MQVLIAEQSTAARFLLEELAREWGYDPVSVAEGTAAWQALSRPDTPQLAILDWVLPGTGGLELCTRVKAREDGEFVYVILLTNKGEGRTVGTALAAGADDFLTKPVDASELQSRLAVGSRTVEYEKALHEKEYLVRLECYRALTDLAETRDQETGQHLRRMALYSESIAEGMDMDAEYVKNVKTFATLHDIGKVGIPDSILRAPRRLLDHEFEIMKTHASLGFDILRDRPTLELAAEIAHSHHERFDGKGYPLGLARREVPLSGRIIALADVYDALRSRRPYKEPWTHQAAVDMIVKSSGTQFDPEVVDIFVTQVTVFEQIAEEHSDPE